MAPRNVYRDVERLRDWRIRGPAARGSHRQRDRIATGWLRESERLRRRGPIRERTPVAAPLTALAWLIVLGVLFACVVVVALVVLRH